MRRLWLIFTQAVTVALAVLFVVGTLKPHWLGEAPADTPLSQVISLRTAAPAASAPASGIPPTTNLATAARLAMPAVVSVTTSVARQRNPHADVPGMPGLFGGRGQPQEGHGSGVIVSPEGILLTNHHVIEGASEIDVRLADGREARATVVGTDPETDLAVLRVALDKLPSITLGRTDSLHVGDPVLAIGNPFNVGQTVTSGIVSALGRQGLGLSTFENFTQTDAAINPGNSGGALVDVHGQLIGINTAIFSRSGGSVGIGFAIPVDVAQRVMESLLRDGVVRRGWIGVEPRELSAEFIDSFKLPVSRGVLITGVLQNGPAFKAGMKPGDVVTEVAGQPVSSVPALLNAVAALKPGEAAEFGVQRVDKALNMSLMVAQRPSARQQGAGNGPRR